MFGSDTKYYSKDGGFMKVKLHSGSVYIQFESNRVDYTFVEISTEKTKIMFSCGWNQPPTDWPCAYGDVMLEGLTFGESNFNAVIVPYNNSDQRGIIESINEDIPVYMHEDIKCVLDTIADFNNTHSPRVDVYFEERRKEIIGDISITLLKVDCRTPGRMLFLIEGDNEKILYTDGFKTINSSNYNMLEKIDIILCEKIYFGTPDDIDIRDLEDEVDRIMQENTGHVFAFCSVTDTKCIKYVERACRGSGRKLVIDPFTKIIQDQVTNQLFINPIGLLPHNNGLYPRNQNRKKYGLSSRIQEHIDRSDDIDFAYIGKFASLNADTKRSNLTFLVRYIMYHDVIFWLAARKQLLNSVMIDLNRECHKDGLLIKEFIKLLSAMGINIETIHVSNHSYREKLMTVIAQLKPNVLIPIGHGSAEVFYEICKEQDCKVIELNAGVVEEISCTHIERSGKNE